MQESTKWNRIIFGLLLGFTLIIWILRGLEVLSFLSSGVIWLLTLITIGFGTFSAIQSTRR